MDRLVVGLDHVVIATRNIDAAVAACGKLLNRDVDWRSEREGAASAYFTLENVAVEVMAPSGAGAGGERLASVIENDGEGLKSVVFAVSDIERMHRRATRVGLDPGPIEANESYDLIDGRLRAWRVFRANTKKANGARLFFIKRDTPLPARQVGRDGVDGLDHVVIQTADPDRAAALYGARLGLDMRLDRQIADRRLLFFRCGDAIVELAHETRCEADADRLWGLSWRVASADAAHARMAAAGFDVSEVRAGLKPGTQVFTVRNGVCGVPTLILERSLKRD